MIRRWPEGDWVMLFKKSVWAVAAICAAVGIGACTAAYTSSATADNSKMAEKKDIIDTATGPGMQQVTTLVTAIKAAGLVDTLKKPGPYTVFAPTNDAFAKLPKGTLEDLLKPENKDKLTAILTYHVHAGNGILAKDVKTMDLKTVQGKDLKIKVEGGKVWVNNAQVIKTDVVCSNGVIHWIDAVVLP